MRPRLVALFLACALCPRAAAQGPQEYAASLKGSLENNPGLKLFGPEAAARVKFEPDGLRITLPPGSQAGGQGTGVISTFGLKGDFDVSVAYEILREVPPQKPEQQARVSLGIVLERPGFNMVTATRRVDGRGQTHFGSWVTLAEKGAKNKAQFKGVETKSSAGRLRLTRTGADVFYYEAETPNGEYVRRHTFSFGAEDVRDVRLVAATDDAVAEMDVRLTDLRLQAAALTNQVAAPVPLAKGELPPVPPPARRWLLVTGLSCLVLALLAPVAAWALWRLRRRADQSPRA